MESVSTDTEVAEFAGQLFFRLWRASHTRTTSALGELGLTPALFALLNVLGAREGTIQQQLSSDMGIDPSAMVKLINELEQAGLAERRRRPNDRRAWEVVITPKGRRTLERARRSASEVEDQVLAGLSASDRRQLLTLLHRALESAPPQPPWRTEEETKPAGDTGACARAQAWTRPRGHGPGNINAPREVGPGVRELVSYRALRVSSARAGPQPKDA